MTLYVIYCNQCLMIYNLGFRRKYFGPRILPIKRNVIFKNLIKAGSEYGYSYEFFWDGMFPIDGTDFTLKANAKRILFDLIIPKTWELLYVRAYEKDNNGATSFLRSRNRRRFDSFKRLGIGDYSGIIGGIFGMEVPL